MTFAVVLQSRRASWLVGIGGTSGRSVSVRTLVPWHGTGKLLRESTSAHNSTTTHGSGLPPFPFPAALLPLVAGTASSICEPSCHSLNDVTDTAPTRA
jgi:hypothetical protein